jgi:hypothetical protein
MGFWRLGIPGLNKANEGMMKVLCTALICVVASATGWSQQASLPPAKSEASSTSTAPTKPKTTAQTKAPDVAAVSPTVKKEPPPEHPCTEAQIREYLTETGGDQAAHVIMSNMARISRASAPPYFPAAFWTDMLDVFQKTDVVSVFLPVYQQHISEEEMAAVLSFYRTPAGKHFLDAQPQMASEVQQILAKKGRDIGHDIYLKHQDEIETAKRQYDTEHGGANGSGAAPGAAMPTGGVTPRALTPSAAKPATATTTPAPAATTPAATPTAAPK